MTAPAGRLSCPPVTAITRRYIIRLPFADDKRRRTERSCARCDHSVFIRRFSQRAGPSKDLEPRCACISSVMTICTSPRLRSRSPIDTATRDVTTICTTPRVEASSSARVTWNDYECRKRAWDSNSFDDTLKPNPRCPHLACDAVTRARELRQAQTSARDRYRSSR